MCKTDSINFLEGFRKAISDSTARCVIKHISNLQAERGERFQRVTQLLVTGTFKMSVLKLQSAQESFPNMKML